jgi:hypothetical protein
VRSLLALVVAVGMVVGALYVRGSLGGEGGGPLAPRDPLQLVCVTELKPVCDALAGERVAVRSQDAGRTAGTLTAGDEADADLWLTLAPWPTIVAETRTRAGADPLSEAEPIRIGRSPLMLVVWEDRAAVLAQRCRTDFSWRCVGRFAGGTWEDAGGDARWGRLKPGHADPTASAAGLLVLGQAVSDYLGTADFFTRDLDADDGFSAWFSDLERAVPNFGGPGSSPLQQMVQFGRGRFDVVGTTDAEAGPFLHRSADRARGLIVRPAKPLVVAEVVLAPLRPDGASRAGEILEPAQDALAAAGWQVEGRDLAPGVSNVPLPDDAGTPSAGVLDALRSRWEEIRR